tara:strand:+ start:35 stop:505 length:471 start_codon:yes stop_codon:yes gene_type:complete
MRNEINVIFIICLTFVICYLIFKIYNKPNPEFFNTSATNLDETSLSKAIEEKKNNFINQIDSQNLQNREISILRKKIDTLRNDLVIMKKQEQDELGNIYNRINSNDSLSQALSSNKRGLITKMINNRVNSNMPFNLGDQEQDSDGRNYNLNFNLQD